jgi:DNA-directed RNA polymerase specialized sigma subunit
MRAGEAARAATAAARQALRDIEADPERLHALDAAVRLFYGLRELSDEAAELRARIVVALVDTAGMTRKQVAEHLGVSVGRVGQIYRAGRAS